MSTRDTFHGWLGHDKASANGAMVHGPFAPKTWSETDIEIRITHCGICGSDLHTLRSGWAPTLYPCCVGHEIIGHAVRVGADAANSTGVSEGDRVGVGAQSLSCLRADCEECSAGVENHCQRVNVGTYNGKYPGGMGRSFGGYADFWRGPGSFVFKIPEGLRSEEAAPMLCGGVTVWSPLVRSGAGPGKRVGIIGIGGLGHFGILFAKALGCEQVVAISRGSGKREDAVKMGADAYIATDEEKDWARKWSGSLDLVICTVSGPNMPLSKYLRLLKVRGHFVQVGAPEDPIPAMRAFALIGKGVSVSGSSIGSPAEIREMLSFAEREGVRSWVQTRPMKEANQVIVDMEKGKARYRYVLVNPKETKL